MKTTPSDAAPPAETSEPAGKEIDLNQLFPGEKNDLNTLFPDPEVKTLLKKISKNRKDIQHLADNFKDESTFESPPL